MQMVLKLIETVMLINLMSINMEMMMKCLFQRQI